jgi:primase-polymerase (primpol)-like protein
VHVLLEGELPDGRNRRETIELYDEVRYFTVTGAHDGTPRSIEPCGDALAAVHAEHVARGTHRTRDQGHDQARDQKPDGAGDPAEDVASPCPPGSPRK